MTRRLCTTPRARLLRRRGGGETRRARVATRAGAVHDDVFTREWKLAGVDVERERALDEMVDEVAVRGDARARAETAVREVFRVDATGDDGERKTTFDGEVDDGVGGLVWVHGDDVRASFEDVEEDGARLVRR